MTGLALLLLAAPWMLFVFCAILLVGLIWRPKATLILLGIVCGIVLLIANAHAEYKAGCDPTSIPAWEVVRLCAEQRDALRDNLLCHEAGQLEAKYHHPPCWETNRC